MAATKSILTDRQRDALGDARRTLGNIYAGLRLLEISSKDPAEGDNEDIVFGVAVVSNALLCLVEQAQTRLIAIEYDSDEASTGARAKKED